MSHSDCEQQHSNLQHVIFLTFLPCFEIEHGRKVGLKQHLEAWLPKK